MRYLVDTSALVRIIRRQSPAGWQATVERGLVAICDPVIVETLAMADSKQYVRVEEDLRSAYPWVPVPDDVWELVAQDRRELAANSQHQGLSVADHLVVATALRQRLVVLHEDGDFETVARYLPQLQQQRLSNPPD